MKKWVRRAFPFFLICIAGIAAVWISIVYFNFISQRIYEDSTGHLSEIYGQVNRAFGSFVEKNWGLLDSWGDSLVLAEEKGGSAAADFIAGEQDYWGFSEFYFLSGDERCMTLSGLASGMALGGSWDSLIRQREPVMAGETLPDGREVTVFAVPVPHGTYGDFPYDAIAISYTNADLAKSLNAAVCSTTISPICGPPPTWTRRSWPGSSATGRAAPPACCSAASAM